MIQRIYTGICNNNEKSGYSHHILNMAHSSGALKILQIFIIHVKGNLNFSGLVCFDEDKSRD
jgi:hypothetical protein